MNTLLAALCYHMKSLASRQKYTESTNFPWGLSAYTTVSTLQVTQLLAELADSLVGLAQFGPIYLDFCANDVAQNGFRGGFDRHIVIA